MNKLFVGIGFAVLVIVLLVVVNGAASAKTTKSKGYRKSSTTNTNICKSVGLSESSNRNESQSSSSKNVVIREQPKKSQVNHLDDKEVEFSKEWDAEFLAWVEKKDIFDLRGPFEFVDSKGYKHLMACGVSELCRTNKIGTHIAKSKATLEANGFLLKAKPDADVTKETKTEGASTSVAVHISGHLSGVLSVKGGVVEKNGKSYCYVIRTESPNKINTEFFLKRMEKNETAREADGDKK